MNLEVVNPWALTWTLASITGALLDVYLIAEAVRDKISLGPLRNGRRKRVYARLLTYSLMLTVHAPFAYVGYRALANPVRPGSEISYVILIYGSLILVVVALINVYVGRLEPTRASVAEANAQDLIATADAAAEQLRQTAREAAAALVLTRAATDTAVDAQVRTAVAAERIADATEKNDAT